MFIDNSIGAKNRNRIQYLKKSNAESLLERSVELKSAYAAFPCT